MRTFIGRTALGFATRENTVIGCIATNAAFGKEGINKIAQMAHNGLALSIRPAHTMLDGDTIFALSLGNKKADVSSAGAFAAEVLARAIINAVKAAKSVAGLPAVG
jgi:L-aminopeptidase/D-esterase-like protein